jgi:hypothetical protein
MAIEYQAEPFKSYSIEIEHNIIQDLQRTFRKEKEEAPPIIDYEALQREREEERKRRFLEFDKINKRRIESLMPKRIKTLEKGKKRNPRLYD